MMNPFAASLFGMPTPPQPSAQELAFALRRHALQTAMIILGQPPYDVDALITVAVRVQDFLTTGMDLEELAMLEGEAMLRLPAPADGGTNE